MPSAAEFTKVNGGYTVTDVARMYGVSEKTIYREIARGRLRCIHIGRAVRITPKQLEEYVEEVASGQQ